MTDEGNREELAEALLGVLATPSNAGPEPIEVAATATATRRRRLIRVALVGWFLLGALWIARPAFIFSPTTGLAVAPVRDEAGLRYAMFLQASRIDEFVDEHARLPSSLAEAGDLEAGVEWERRGSTGWILTGVEGGLKLKLTDGMSVDSFLGNSIGTIRRR